MCGYLCDICKAFAPNIKKKDERERLSALWTKYYDLDIPAERIYCEGCRSVKKDATRIDNNCPVRACVLQNRIDNCGQCSKYPCEVFMERKGLSYEEARKEQGQYTLNELAGKYQIAPTTLSGWHKQFQERPAEIFRQGPSEQERILEEKEQEIAVLQQEVGQLTIEQDWLKRI